MKKLLTLLLILCVTAAAVSCTGSSDTPSDTDGSAPAATDTQTGTDTDMTPVTDEHPGTDTEQPSTHPAEGYLIRLDSGVSIQLGAAAEDALQALGTYSDLMEAPSCIHEGFDRVYTWSGLYTLTTAPNAQGQDYITEFSLLSDLSAVVIGDAYLSIGSSESDIRTALGDPTEDVFGVQTYRTEGAVITVTIDGGAVTGFVLAYPAN